MNPTGRVHAESLTVTYPNGGTVLTDLTLTIPDGKVTVICGPNGCGKSTLLRTIARLVAPQDGVVHLDGTAITRLSSRYVATQLGLLVQSPVAPEGLIVEDLVARGRHPHQRWLQRWTPEDEAATESALDVTGMLDLRHRRIDELSGGQRQRAWIAMALAQQTDILLLDEPTTFLDLAHRIEVLDLLAELNAAEARTIVMVLHDLNEACRYAHRIVAMREGRIHAEGIPAEVITSDLVGTVFGVDSVVISDPVSGTPLVVPVRRSAAG